MTMRAGIPAILSILLFGCGKTAQAPGEGKQAAKRGRVKITQFYAADKLIPKGLPGKLCYGVENAAKLALDPASEDVWPSAGRCVEISPKRKTTYTLTAWGEDGSEEKKSVDVRVAGEPPRIYDLWVSAVDVKPGDLVRVCFKLENATKVRASPGKLAQGINCINDRPKKTTTYRIVAYGSDRQEDTGAVTVNVR